MTNTNILITGGTGSWAGALVELLLKTEVQSIKLMARNEEKLVALRNRYADPRLQLCVGDIRSRERLLELTRGCDTVFHLAALKHVPVCEAAPSEALATNVEGTRNVIHSAVVNGVGKVVYASTDKAVSPQCTYGCTKLLGEKLMQAAHRAGVSTKFITLRSGNLLGSAGSVLPLFRSQIAENGQVTLTDERMNRFFLPIETAAELLLEAAEKGAGGEIFLPLMPSLRVADIAAYLLRQYSLDSSHIRLCGLRPGEKLNEQMVTENEREHIYRVSTKLCVIAPENRSAFAERLESYPLSSCDAVLNYENAAGFLQAAGF